MPCNTAAKRSLRGVALGRKTWLFAVGGREGERAAAMYSLIVTAKLNDVDPRAWLAAQQGWRARANAAQQNSFEAFPLFAAGVVLALVQEVDPTDIAECGWFFVAMRIAYIYCYVVDRATPRSVFWALGYAAVVRLYVLAW